MIQNTIGDTCQWKWTLWIYNYFFSILLIKAQVLWLTARHFFITYTAFFLHRILLFVSLCLFRNRWCWLKMHSTILSAFNFHFQRLVFRCSNEISDAVSIVFVVCCTFFQLFQLLSQLAVCLLMWRRPIFSHEFIIINGNGSLSFTSNESVDKKFHKLKWWHRFVRILLRS